MTDDKIKKHKIAAKKLDLIKDEAFRLIGGNIGKISEYKVNRFILSEFKKQGLITQKEYPAQIVGFDQNTSVVHYHPKVKGSQIIKKNSLVLIDMWARLNEKGAPFADITWMGYTGKNVPKEIRKIFKLVIGDRDEVIRFIKKNLKSKKLPKSIEIERTARDYFDKFDVEKFFTHGLGHSLGLTRVHGTYFRFSKKSKSKLKLNIPFTIEPGLYFKGKFGVRSEGDYCITEDYRLVVTTRLQKKLIKI